MKKIHNKIHLNIFISVLLLIFGAALILYFSYYFGCGSFKLLDKYADVLNLAILFNYLPIVSLAFMFAVLCGNAFYGLGITTFIIEIFSFADYYMIKYRGEPITYGDLFSIKEGLAAVNQFSIEIDVLPLVLIIAAVLLLLFLGYITKSGKIKFPLRFIIAGVILLCSVLLCNLMYTKDYQEYDDLINNKTLSNQYNRNIRCQMLGPVFFFINSHSDYSIEEPESYNRSEMKKLTEDNSIDNTVSSTDLPDVIFISCECFSDLADIDFLNYSSSNNPLSEYHNLCNEDNSISGYLYVPVYGGGTCNTELEVLRSMFSQYASGNMANVTNGKKDSIATRFKEYGYQTVYIHPGDDWFYNRKNVMKNIGFDELYFKDDFINPEYTSEMISDKSVGEFIINQYERLSKDSGPVFIDAMTIAGHFPFYWEEGMPYVSLNGELSSESHTELSAYLNRISGTNIMMEYLVDYFKNSSEPVILVFYGDHLPALGDNGSVYEEIGYPIYNDSGEELPEKYKIPYVIWGNEAASSYFDDSDCKITDGNISAAYLGVSVLDLIGLAQGNSYYEFLLGLKNELPIIKKNYVVDTAGNEYQNIPIQYQSEIERLKCWNYYYLKDN